MTERKTRPARHAVTFGERLRRAGDQVMQALRARARRRDPVGDATYRGMEVVHGGLELTIRSLGRLERATQPPHRVARHEPHEQAAEPATGRPAAARHQSRPRPGGQAPAAS
jgi:hypothetical protein